MILFPPLFFFPPLFCRPPPPPPNTPAAPAPISFFPAVIGTITSCPIVRLRRWAAALSSPVSLWRERLGGPGGSPRSRHSQIAAHRPGPRSVPETHALTCLAPPSAQPSPPPPPPPPPAP